MCDEHNRHGRRHAPRINPSGLLGPFYSAPVFVRGTSSHRTSTNSTDDRAFLRTATHRSVTTSFVLFFQEMLSTQRLCCRVTFAFISTLSALTSSLYGLR